MALKSLDGIKPTLKQELIEVPELGDDAQIIVREMTAQRFSKYQKAIREKFDYPVESMLIACMVNDEHEQIASHGDELSISEMLPIDVSNRLFEACKRVNSSIFDSKDSKKKS